jgi:hypothetical protein
MEPRIAKVTVSTIEPSRRRRRSPKPRMYFFPVGESTMEHLFNRHNRPVKEFRKLITLALVEAGHELSGAKEVKARWSQYAGCSCPCSPGFILDMAGNQDFFVDVEIPFPKFQEDT